MRGWRQTRRNASPTNARSALRSFSTATITMAGSLRPPTPLDGAAQKKAGFTRSSLISPVSTRSASVPPILPPDRRQFFAVKPPATFLTISYSTIPTSTVLLPCPNLRKPCSFSSFQKIEPPAPRVITSMEPNGPVGLTRSTTSNPTATAGATAPLIA